MNNSPTFNMKFSPQIGRPVSVAENVVRITCGNSGPFTYTGTNSYLVGKTELALIDPGPIDHEHFDALVSAIDGRQLTHIVVTHTHVDHSPLASRMRGLTGAQIVGAAPHFAARALHIGEINPLDASADRDYAPAIVMRDGESIAGPDWALEAIETPGHTANHIALALEDTGIVFTGDHIMGWSTSIVAPPDGSMKEYMASLDKMLLRDDELYLPGHGGEVRNPRAFVRGLKSHRGMRERAIVERLRLGDETIASIVSEIYRDTDKRLHGAAGLSVFAQLEYLIEKNLVETDGSPSLEGLYRLV